VLNTLLFWATAPIRLFGRSPAFRLGLGAFAVIVFFFAVTLWALDTFWPGSAPDVRPPLAQLQPLPALKPATRASHVITPVAVSLAAIRRSLDAAAPRDLAGKNDNPVSSLLSKADIGITVSRGPMVVSGYNDEITIATPLTGSLKITGQVATQAGNLTGTIAGLLDKSIGSGVQKLTSRVLDQRAELGGQVSVRSRPALTPNWRIEPRMTAQVGLSDTNVQLAGLKINLASEAKPLIDRAVNQQVSSLEQRLRNDPMLEQTARREWAKMCRSIPLGGGRTGLPELWLEMRPIRAAAAQPKIDPQNITITIGVQAETRILPQATKPECPFPARLEIVPAMQNGQMAIGLPIDVPFTALNALMETQLKGKRFPEGGDSSVDVEVKRASLAASGDRLLVSLLVKARERKSWFGFGAEATVHIWGKPALDAKSQILRLTDVSLAVESEAAFGLLGAAARAAMPYLQAALQENAVIDLKPFAADALGKITVALKDFQQSSPGVRVDAAVQELRLVGIEFDSTMLRVVAEADGSVNVAVTDLPKM
jgi:hypothetical protein